jgi:hypothetical protein
VETLTDFVALIRASILSASSSVLVPSSKSSTSAAFDAGYGNDLPMGISYPMGLAILNH